MKNFEPFKKYFEFELQYMKPETREKLFKNITAHEKNDMYLYNYNKNVLVDRDNCVLMKCRGLVLDKNAKVLNYPFDRFFNDFEKESDDIDWKTAKVQKKIDGSLICVFWNNKKWIITTRGSFYPTPRSDVDYSKLFKKHFTNFKDLDKSICYMFELVTQQNIIVTLYEEENVYLLGARSLIDKREMGKDYLDMMALQLRIKRPKVYDATNIEACKELFNELRDDEEGLVVVDQHFNRIKLKQDSYIRLSKIKELRPQHMFEYVLKINPLDEEYLKKCPEVLEEIEEIKKEWNKKLKMIIKVFDTHSGLDDRKDIAIAIKDYPFKSLLFNMYDNKDIIKVTEQYGKKVINLKWDKIKEW